MWCVHQYDSLKIHKCIGYSGEGKLHIWKRDPGEKPTSEATLMKTGELVRWQGKSWEWAWERMGKVGEGVLENELDLLQYWDKIPNCTV